MTHPINALPEFYENNLQEAIVKWAKAAFNTAQLRKPIPHPINALRSKAVRFRNPELGHAILVSTDSLTWHPVALVHYGSAAQTLAKDIAKLQTFTLQPYEDLPDPASATNA